MTRMECSILAGKFNRNNQQTHTRRTEMCSGSERGQGQKGKDRDEQGKGKAGKELNGDYGVYIYMYNVWMDVDVRFIMINIYK